MSKQILPNYWIADSKPEQWLRMIISACILIVGMSALVRGYELAYGDGEHEIFRPNGYSNDLIYISTAIFSWFACLLGRRLRLLSWAMIGLLAWWAFKTRNLYLDNLYYVLGRDGCLPCGEQLSELHLWTTCFALACGCWVLISRRPSANRWPEISVFMVVWLILTLLVSATVN